MKLHRVSVTDVTITIVGDSTNNLCASGIKLTVENTQQGLMA